MVMGACLPAADLTSGKRVSANLPPLPSPRRTHREGAVVHELGPINASVGGVPQPPRVMWETWGFSLTDPSGVLVDDKSASASKSFWMIPNPPFEESGMPFHWQLFVGFTFLGERAQVSKQSLQ
jgi:hypothetical protein